MVVAHLRTLPHRSMHQYSLMCMYRSPEGQELTDEDASGMAVEYLIQKFQFDTPMDIGMLAELQYTHDGAGNWTPDTPGINANGEKRLAAVARNYGLKFTPR